MADPTFVERVEKEVENVSNLFGLEQGGGGGTFSSVTFPSSLNSEKGLRPIVQFNCLEGKSHKGGQIILPAPSSFATADNAQYGDTELGFGGKLAMNLVRSATSSEGREQLGSQFDNLLNKGTDTVKGLFSGDSKLDNFKDLGSKLAPGAALAYGASLQDSGGGIGKGVAMAVGATFNKNVTTEFTSVSTRGFSFTYELVPSSQAEGQTIHNMIVALREGVYPSTAVQGTILRYPPKWKINFYEGLDNQVRLKSFPALAECYLESFTTTYNGNNSFHIDGRPVKTDISLNFKEDRSLTLDDIRELEESSGKD